MGLIGNVALPAVAGHLGAMLVLFLPVVAIEALVLSRRHSIEYGASFDLMVAANARSTLWGIPIGYVFAWAGLIPAGMFAALLPERARSVVSIIIFNSVFHGGHIPTKLDAFGFCAGTLLILIPYFVVTVNIERRYLSKQRPDIDSLKLGSTVRMMNDVSYGLIAIPLLIGAGWETARIMSTYGLTW